MRVEKKSLEENTQKTQRTASIFKKHFKCLKCNMDILIESDIKDNERINLCSECS